MIEASRIIPGTRVRVYLPTSSHPDRTPAFATGTVRMYQDGDFVESPNPSKSSGRIQYRANRRLVDSMGHYWVELDHIQGDTGLPIRVIARREEMTALA